jgi:hypothetical protein
MDTQKQVHSLRKERGKIRRMLLNKHFGFSESEEPTPAIVDKVLNAFHGLGVSPGDFKSAKLRNLTLILVEALGCGKGSEAK